MRNSRPLLTLLLLMLPMALSGCGAKENVRQYVPVTCPPLPPVPAPLMQPLPPPLHSAQQTRSLLFESVTPQISAKPTSGH